MSARLAAFWYKASETLLFALVFVLPLAFYLQTYDSVTIKTTTFQVGILALLTCWLVKGFERGRWELPSAAWPLLTPALALAAWTCVRFAVAPYKSAALPGFLQQLLYLLTYGVVLMEFGGLGQARRLCGWLLAAAWVSGLYGLSQAFGLDPFIWKGAFGKQVFSTFGNPDFFGLFLALCVPVALTRHLDPELDGNWKGLDLALLLLLAVDLALTGSSETLVALAILGPVFAVVVSILIPARAAVRSVALAGLVTLGALFGASRAGVLTWEGKTVEQSFLDEGQFKRQVWPASWKMVQARPLEGWGPGGFAVHFPKFRPVQLIALEGRHNSRTDHPGSQLLEVAVELGAVGAALWLWLFGALLLAGWRAAVVLRREGALGEAAYAAGLLAVTLGLLAAGQLGLGSQYLMPGWLLWPIAGTLGGLTLVARQSGSVSVLPIPLTESQRKTLYAPAFAVFAGLAFLPLSWFQSDVEHNMAIAYYKGGEFDRGFEHADRVRPGAAAYTMAQYFKAKALTDAGRFDEAIRQYERVESIEPDYVLVHYNKGVAYAKLKDWDNAIASHQQAARLDPLFVANFQRIAEAARAAGDLATARKAVFSAIALQPQEPQHWRELAQLFVKQQRLAASRRIQRHAAQLTGPDSKPADIR